MKIERNYEREEEVFKIVKDNFEALGKTPTLEAMGKTVGCEKSTIYYYLKRLVKAKRIKQIGRSYQPIE